MTKSIYKATAPNGRVLTKQTAETDAQHAVMYAYEHNGVWVASGVFAYDNPLFASQTPLQAERVR